MLFKKHFQSKNQIHDFPSLLRAVLEPAYSNCLYLLTFYRWLSRKESACQSWRLGFNPWVRKIPWRRKRQPTPVFLPAEFPWTEEPIRPGWFLADWYCSSHRGNQLQPQGQQRSGSLCPWWVYPQHLGSQSSVPLGYGLTELCPLKIDMLKP